jgi:hypothetical protein
MCLIRECQEVVVTQNTESSDYRDQSASTPPVQVGNSLARHLTAVFQRMNKRIQPSRGSTHLLANTCIIAVSNS